MQDHRKMDGGDDLKSAFLTSVLENLSDIVFVKNSELVYVGATQSFAKLLGVESAADIIGKTDEELFHDLDLAKRYREDDLRLLTTGETFKNYIEPTVLGGQSGFCQTSKYPLFNDSGDVVGLYAITRDVTLEHKTRLNYEQELRVLFQLSSNALAAALFDVTNWKLADLRIVDRDFHTEERDVSVDVFAEREGSTVQGDAAVRKFYSTFSQEGFRSMFDSGKRHFTLEYQRRLRPGTIHWVSVDLHFMLDPSNGDLRVAWILKDIEKQKRAEQALARAAEWDALTSVYNREATMTRIRQFLTGEGASGTHWLFMVDVDNFKMVNDTFGHRSGDQALVNIAAAIRSVFRERDIVGRVGGDEFFVLMKNTKELSAAAERAKKLVEALQYVCSENNKRIDLSGSVGISCYGGGGKTLERLYAEADSALYRAKQAGKNRYAFAAADMEDLTDKGKGQEPISAVHLQTLLENMDATMFQTELTAEGEICVTYSSHSLFSKGEGSQIRVGARGENIWNAVLPEEREPLKEAVRRATERGSFLEHICRVYNSKGQIEWRHIRGLHLPLSQDGVGRMIHVVTDITRQKQVEAELREKDSIIDFAMRNTDVNLWYFDYEKAECQLTKSCQKAHEMPGVETLTDFPECLFKMGYVREDCIELLRATYDNLRKTGESTEFDTWFRKADGSGWWCERDMLSPLLGADGRVTRGIGIGKNVTAEKEMEEKFHIFQSYRQVAEKNTMASVRMNLTTGWCGDYVNNSATLLKISQADDVDGFFRETMEDILSKEDGEAFSKLSRQYLLEVFARGETSLSFEYRCQTQEGSPVWLRSDIDMMKNPATGDVEALYYVFDIDYEKNMNLLVDQLLAVDYEFLGLIDVVTDRLMVFGDIGDGPDMARNGEYYEEAMRRVFRGLIEEEYYEEGIRTMAGAHVIRELETKEFYTCSFPARDFAHTKAGRKQWKFSYLDDTKSKILATRTDITSIYTAERDPLTGLYNRETFYRHTRRVLEQNPSKSFLLMRFDIDRFKAYNDVCGVKAGDRILAELGRQFRRQNWPEASVFGRLEADHFVCMVPVDEFDVDGWHQEQMRYLESVAAGYRLTSSVGIYDVVERNMDVSLMCDRALLALRTVKDNYTNKLAWYDESLRDKLMREQSMVDEMEQALEDRQFVVYFQPLVHYDSGKIVGAEALVRWMHPKHGLVMPDEFIPLFEKNGFILKLDAYVWERSCQFLRKWLDERQAAEPVPVSVNISRCDLYDPELCERLQGILERYGLPLSLLKLEITESAYMDDPEQLISVVNKLQAMGFLVEMDDFGTGYSSLNMLKDVTVDVLKLDTRFLSESGDDARGTTILSAIIHMARDLGISVIAEGVETRQQADYLKDLKCAYMQGYYFGRPMPAEKFEEIMGQCF